MRVSRIYLVMIFFNIGLTNSWASYLSSKIRTQLKNENVNCVDFSGKWEGNCKSGESTHLTIEQSNCNAIKIGDFWSFFGSSQNITDNFNGGIVQTTKLANLEGEKMVRLITNEELILFRKPHQLDRTSSVVKINLIDGGRLNYEGERLLKISGTEDQVEKWKCILEKI